jgi:iron complex transport system permease protein
MVEPREELVAHISERTSRDDLVERYGISRKKKIHFILGIVAAIAVMVVVGLSLGPTDIPFSDTLKIIVNCVIHVFDDVAAGFTNIVVEDRMPRVFMAVVVGAALAAAGCVMQGILRNPLVSPFTLGVSTAAAFGAGIAIVMGPALFGGLYSFHVDFIGQTFSGSALVTMLFAFLFGMLSIALVIILARDERVSKATLVLSGVVVSYLFQAGLSFLKYISDDGSLRDITLWTMGNLWSATWVNLFIMIIPVIICLIYLEKISIDINTLSAGTSVANNLGTNVAKLRMHGLLVCTVVVCVCLSFTGAIGFIGLMAPHICRRLIGNDNRYLLPASALMGGLILLISDTVARNAFSSDVPVGILIYLIGGGFFIWMVVNKRWREVP